MRAHHRMGQAVLVAAALLTLPASDAGAAIPDAAGVYTACRLNALGTIRLIDPSLPASALLGSCTVFETKFSWSKGAKGETGPQGLQGLTGLRGPQGLTGVEGQPGPKGEPGVAGANGNDGQAGVPGPQGAAGPQGPKGDPGSSSGPALETIATLQWEPADRAFGEFAVGDAPVALAFDGSNIWVANQASDNVMKLRASSGVSLGTFAVGDSPCALAFDGENVWVANTGSDSVTKLQASDGATLGTFAVGDGPSALAFDRTNMWVANSLSDNVTKLGRNGDVLGTFAVGDGPSALAHGFRSIWVANRGDGNVTKLQESDGSTLGTFPPVVAADKHPNPSALAYDGRNLWVANAGEGFGATGTFPTVTQSFERDGTLLHSYADLGRIPVALAFDGASMWVADSHDNTVAKLRGSDLALQGTWATGVFSGGVIPNQPTPYHDPGSVAFDGSSIWVANKRDDTVTKIAR
jgi:hypothetical protein